MRPLGSRLRPGAVFFVLLAVALSALAVGLLTIDRVGEAIIGKRQREVAEAARDYFVAFAHEEGLAPLARALDLREKTDPGGAFREKLKNKRKTMRLNKIRRLLLTNYRE